MKRFLLLLLLGAGGAVLLLQATSGAIVASLLDEAVKTALAVPFRRGEVRCDLPRPSLKVAPFVFLEEEGGVELLRVEEARAHWRFSGLSPRLAGLTLRGPDVRIRPGMRTPFRTGGLAGSSGASGGFRLLVSEGHLLWEGGPEGARRLEDLHLDLASGDGSLAGEGGASWPGGTVSAALRLGRGGVLLDGIVRLASEPSGPLEPFDPEGPVAIALRYEEGKPLRVSASPQALAIRIPGTETRVEGVTGTLGAEGATARFDLAGTWRGGSVGTRGTARLEEGGSLDADVEATGLVLDEALRPLAALDRTALEVFEGLAPRGKVDLLGTIRREGGAWDGAFAGLVQELEVRCEGFLDRRKGRVYGFPYPVRVRGGAVDQRRDRLWLHGFAGAMGKASFSLDAELSAGLPHGFEVDVRAEALPLDEEVRRALAAIEGGARVFDDFAPEGPADVRVRLSHPPRAGALRYVATIESRGASARWASFPLRVRDLAGRIVLEEDRLEFDLAGSTCSGRVRVEGLLSGPRSHGGPPPGLRLRVSGKGLEIGPELREACSRALAPHRVLDELAATGGTLDFEATAWRPRGAPERDFGLEVRAEIEGTSCLIPPVGLRAGGVTGAVFLERRAGRTTIRAEALRGEVLGSTVFGSFESREKEGREELAAELDAPRVRIDPRIQEIFAKALGQPWLDPAIVEAAGSLDFHVEWGRASASRSPSARLRLRDVSLRGRDVPFLVDGIDGSILADAGGVRCERDGLAFRIAGGGVKVGPLSLRLQGGRPVGSFVLRGSDLPLSSSLDRGIPPELTRALRALRTAGKADLEEIRVDLRTGEGGAPLLEATGSIWVPAASLDPGIPISLERTRVSLERLAIGPGGTTMVASVVAEDASLLGLTVKDLKVSLQARPEGLAASALAGELAGGVLRGREERDPLVVLLGDLPSLSVSLALDEARLRDLLADLLPGAGNLSGLLDARLDLEGTPGDLGSFRGEGRVRIVDGALGEVPVFRDVFSFLHLFFELGHAPEFQEGEARFDIGARRIRFRQIELRSDVLEIVGLEDRGELSFEGDVDLLFEARVFPEIPIVRPIYDLLREVLPRIWRLRVRGPLASPRVGYETANPEVNQLLGLTEPRQRRTWLPPIPDTLGGKGPPYF